mmetsp:Transcript_80962/g.227064  ORF Transcript_80962/g.227064 Transcript_80962/m.227064 type:complete len:280 (+) Transcript_80962:603-1442(+)
MPNPGVDHGVEVRVDAAPALHGVEVAPEAPQVDGRGPELVEGEDLVLRQPLVAEVVRVPLLRPTDADARLVHVQEHSALRAIEKLCQLRVVPVGSLVEVPLRHREVAVRASEHVLLLRRLAVDVPAACDFCIRHVQYRESLAMPARHLQRHLAPIPRQHLHLGGPRRTGPPCLVGPPLHIPQRDVPKTLALLLLGQLEKRLAQNLSPPGVARGEGRLVGVPKPPTATFAFRELRAAGRLITRPGFAARALAHFALQSQLAPAAPENEAARTPGGGGTGR